MKKLVFLLVLVAIASFAANSVMHEGSMPINAHPQPAAFNEFYWDDGILANGWAWYTGGNYWAVQFDDTLTGDTAGHINQLGAVTYPGWPEDTYIGAYLHIYDDIGDYPGSSVAYEYIGFTATGDFEWVDGIDHAISTGTFYIAFEQYGDYPADNPDSMAVDAASGTHNWTGYQGSWANTTSYGDFMLRCYWEEGSAVVDSTWGAVKGLYE